MKSPTEQNFSDHPLFDEINNNQPKRRSHILESKKSMEETKIEKYIKLIENEIKKHNFNLDQRCFIENIIKLLDNLSQVNQ